VRLAWWTWLPVIAGALLALTVSPWAGLGIWTAGICCQVVIGLRALAKR